MPVISCPKCQGKMRFPDDSPARRVKCPACGHTFLSTEGVTGDGAPKSGETRTGSKPAPSRGRDDGDRARRSRRDNNDRDHKTSRSRDDDDDDRERARRRSSDDDDNDDNDERVTRRRRSRDLDDDDDRGSRGRQSDRRRDDDDRGTRRGADYDRSESNPRIQEARFGRASMACMLCFVGGWLGFASLCILAFGHFLFLCGTTDFWQAFWLLAGILGLGHWITAGSGLGFLVAGPRNRGALGLAIATAATGGLHFLLLIVCAATIGKGISQISVGEFVGQSGTLSRLAYWALAGRVESPSVIGVFTNLAEVARMILLLLTLRAIMNCAKDTRGAGLAQRTMIGFAIGAGALVVVGLLFGVIQAITQTGKTDARTVETMGMVSYLYAMTVNLVMAGFMVWTTLVIRIIKGNIDYRRD